MSRIDQVATRNLPARTCVIRCGCRRDGNKEILELLMKLSRGAYAEAGRSVWGC